MAKLNCHFSVFTKYTSRYAKQMVYDRKGSSFLSCLGRRGTDFTSYMSSYSKTKTPSKWFLINRSEWKLSQRETTVTWHNFMFTLLCLKAQANSISCIYAKKKLSTWDSMNRKHQQIKRKMNNNNLQMWGSEYAFELLKVSFMHHLMVITEAIKKSPSWKFRVTTCLVSGIIV